MSAIEEIQSDEERGGTHTCRLLPKRRSLDYDKPKGLDSTNPLFDLDPTKPQSGLDLVNHLVLLGNLCHPRQHLTLTCGSMKRWTDPFSP